MEEIKIKKIRNFSLASIIIKFISIIVTIGLIVWFITLNKEIKNKGWYEYDLDSWNKNWYSFSMVHCINSIICTKRNFCLS